MRSMRAFRALGSLGARAFTSKTFVPKSAFNIPRSAISSSTKKGQSLSTDAVKTTLWTPHSLKVSASSNEISDTSSTLKSVKTPQKHLAYIALGSNLGNRIEWIEKACNLMEERGLNIKRTSGLWETEPMYVKDQDQFLNGVAEVETSLEPIALLDALQSIENFLGRVKVVDKGPRNIDLDILLYDDQLVGHPRLTIPHILMREREFVLRPLAELIPGKALDSKNPWKVTQDYLNDLPPTDSPMTTVTPLCPNMEPLRGLDSQRKTRIMAIFNATNDSFSNDLKQGASDEPTTQYDIIEQAIKTFWSQFMDVKPYTLWTNAIIDIGGQSTAPKAPEVSPSEEKARVLQAIQSIPSRMNRNISVDTYRASVAEAAVNAGATIINDVSAGTMDPAMLPTMAKLGVTVILMHMRGTPQTMSSLTYYPNGLIPTIASELLERVAAAEAAGIRRWRIILDPGIGFAKSASQNLEILRRFEELRDWPGLRGLPWLLGSSRKGFIGKITGVEKPSERVWGTAATVVAAVQGGADIVRVHDVGEMGQVASMADAIWRS
ncbi:related to multifunctional folic acid synthesis protein [Rhynchosporium graminicola]|uniref:Folic acid synthesis protein FOL1 n=1 Tax=Rhynchosporium graminicola TaxID=2792576 RepID=A0A1E1KZJ3_9HELO|nr:related to multifunctional folic acid synthesis protein [Rhynchosporium commune]